VLPPEGDPWREAARLRHRSIDGANDSGGIGFEVAVGSIDLADSDAHVLEPGVLA
jgi:hypothetical protein